MFDYFRASFITPFRKLMHFQENNSFPETALLWNLIIFRKLSNCCKRIIIRETNHLLKRDHFPETDRFWETDTLRKLITL